MIGTGIRRQGVFFYDLALLRPGMPDVIEAGTRSPPDRILDPIGSSHVWCIPAS